MTVPKEGQDIRYKLDRFYLSKQYYFILDNYLFDYLFIFCRPIGCDIEKGSLVLDSYTNIGPAEIGLLVACGCEFVTVTKLPCIGILSTGDELQEAGEPLRPGQVYDSNRITLITFLKENGFESLDFGIAVDKYVQNLS